MPFTTEKKCNSWKVWFSEIIISRLFFSYLLDTESYSQLYIFIKKNETNIPK